MSASTSRRQARGGACRRRRSSSTRRARASRPSGPGTRSISDPSRWAATSAQRSMSRPASRATKRSSRSRRWPCRRARWCSRASHRRSVDMDGFARSTLIVMSVLLAGGKVGPDYKRPIIAQPDAFKSQATRGEAPLIAPEWWRLYNAPELDRLVAIANESNQTLKQAVAAVDQARALARVAGSFRYPTISLDPTFERQRTSATIKSPLSGQLVRSVTLNNRLVPIDLPYEVDVWGRVRRS